MRKIIRFVLFTHVLFGLLIFLAWGPFSASSAVSAQPFTGGAATIGDEIYGSAGPLPVNCTDLVYVNAKPLLDAQRAAWTAAAMTALPGSSLFGSLIAGPSGAPVNAPLLLVQPDGFSITVTPSDLPPAQGLASGSNALGVPAFANVQINGSPNGCTLQDNAPRPSTTTGGDYYFNQLSKLNGFNAVRFSFSAPVNAFGAFFGDLETSSRGTLAFLRLLDAGGNLIADVPISSTFSITGGVAAENRLCDRTNVPGADVAAQGLLPGCGNGSTRWIGFVSTTPVAQAMIVVGDNDPLPGGKGLSEKLSFMGPTVIRNLPPAEVTIAKQAPASVIVGVPFSYTLIVANTSPTLAAGVTLTDVAPIGVTFDAVSGANCRLVSAIVLCNIDLLPAGATQAIQIQATATVTASVTNTAQISATNDTDPTNNSAQVTITPRAAPPLNDCASLTGGSGAPLVINEVLYRQAAAANNDEWVELYATQLIPAGAQFYVSDNERGIGEYRKTFTIPAGGIQAGAYLVIHGVTGVDDTNASDGVLHFYNGGNSLKLNDSGDNLTLYQGANATGVVLDYMAYGSSAAVNGPFTGWSLPNAPAPAAIGQSIASRQNGVDTSNGTDWVLAGNGGTLGPATQGANNRGKVNCNVAITKTGPVNGVVGIPFDYQITVSNTSGVTLTGVVMTDTQPAGITFNRVTGAGCNLNGAEVFCAVGRLDPHASRLITVNATASVAQPITNTAYTKAISDTNPADNQATHAIRFLVLGAIGDYVYLDTNANGWQDAGETIPINGVPVTLTRSDGSMTTTVTVDGAYLFPNLPLGVYSVTIGSGPGYTLTSNANAQVTLGASQVYTQADFGFAYALADVAVAKRSAPLSALGATFRYTIEIANLSQTVPALDVVLTDTQPGGVIFNGVSDPRCVLFAGQVTCNLGNLPPLGVDTIVISATARAGGVWVNTVMVAATNESELNNNQASATILVFVPALALQKLTNYQVADAPPGPVLTIGSLVTWTYVVTNTGQITLSAVTLRDDREGIIATGVTLNPGERHSFTQAGVVQSGPYSNTASVNGRNLLYPTQQITVTAVNYYNGINPTPTQTQTPTFTPTAPPTGTDTPSPTASATASPTASSTSTQTPTATPTNTAPPTATALLPATATPTFTPTAPPVNPPTLTATPTVTEPAVLTPTATPTVTSTSPMPLPATATLVPTATPTPTLIQLPGLAGLGDRVWEDNNQNSLQDADELNVPGVVVTLYAGEGQYLAMTITDAKGEYFFANLTPGAYIVAFAPPPAYLITAQNGLDQPSQNSDPDPVSGRAPLIILAPGETNLNLDAGLYKIPTALAEAAEPALRHQIFLPIVGK